jgi:1-acyl-sn-glycerol-3-phosphate acyltransferase/nucleoside-diphosphate-sugar epimerase
VGGDGPLTDAVADALDGCIRATGPAATLDLSGHRGVVYLAADRGGAGGLPDPPEMADAEAVFEAAGRAARAGHLAHLVVVSSAAVWEPSHHHPSMVPEEPLGVDRLGLPMVGAWRRLEEVARRVADEVPGLTLTLLRPAATPVPGGRDVWSRWLGGRFAFVVAGHDPPLQLLDPDDLAEGVRRAVEAGIPGTFHLAPAGVAPVRAALRAAGVRPVPRPPGRRLAPLRYPWTVSGDAAREVLGFEPRHDTLATARRFARREPVSQAVSFDDFGMDRAYIEKASRGRFRVLHDLYWRVEERGLEHIPRQGRVVLAGVHRGFMPFDGVMALYAVRQATGRIPRFLTHPTLVKFPFLADFMVRLGGVHASRGNAERVLEEDEILGIFPEGIRGAFSDYRDAYVLKKFGRDEFVKMALRHRAPIVPFVTVGSAEIFPIWAKLRWRWWRKVSEWPCLPLTATFPLLPVPLPTKWHTRFLPPLHVEREHPPEAADDPEVVRAVSAEVRRRMDEALTELRGRRRHVFFGSIFEEKETP